MRKKYPYLEESYTPNLNVEQEKRHFLSQIDDFVNQRQYVNITLLNWNEDPIKEIDGVISSGSISKDGSSSVRRTCSLSCSVDGGTYNVDLLQMDFSLNKKIFLEIGVKNETDEYPEYPILWFPQGVFYINSFSMSSSTSSAVNINLSLKDKMSLLNGDVGGTLPATVQFDIMTTQLADGTMVDQKVLYYNIITELVNHWGGEDLNNIIVQDVPLRIRRIVQWNGENPIWLYLDNSNSDTTKNYQISLTGKDDEGNSYSGSTKYSQGDDIGYVFSDFVPVGEIVGSAGDTVCSILDKIKNELGNYEYFYDVFGIFHFREIRNYLNVSQSNIVLQESGNSNRRVSVEGQGQFLLDSGSEIQYLIETTNEKNLYSFSDNQNITSISVSPNYGNIKNDFIINGLRKSTASDEQYAVRYRVVIDNKPNVIGTNQNRNYYGIFNNVLYYTYPETYNGETILETNKLAIPYMLDENESLPTVGNADQIYGVYEETDDSSNQYNFYIWLDNSYKKVYLKTDLTSDETSEPIYYYHEDNSGELSYNQTNNSYYYAYDWRTFLYLYGLQANMNGTDPGPYFTDLDAFWPNEYNLSPEKQCFYGEDENEEVYYKSLTYGNYFFDMIDAATSSLGEFSVQNIGRRTDVYTNEEINCLFEPEIPDLVWLNSENPELNWSENTTITEIRNSSASDILSILESQKDECINAQQPWIQVPDNIYASLITGGYLNSAYNAVKYEMFSHLSYQKTVSITAIPAFYLEPNSRVTLTDASTNTFGDFMIQNINLTLGPGANMSVTLNEVFERL